MPPHNETIVDLRPISIDGSFDPSKLPLRAPYRGPVVRLSLDSLKLAWSSACSSLPDSDWSSLAISKHKVMRKQEEIRICHALFDALTPVVMEYTYSYAGTGRVKLALSRGACALLAGELAKSLSPDVLGMQKQLDILRKAWGALGDIKQIEVIRSELDIKLDRLKAIEASHKTA